LFKIGLFRQVEEMHVHLQRKQSVLEVGAYRTLFQCEHWVNIWKENFLKLRVFTVEKDWFGAKYAYSGELKKHMHFSKENHLCFKHTHLAQVSGWELSFLLKGLLPATLGVSTWRYSLFVPNRPVQLNWRSTSIAQQKTICVRSRNI
jgi:hypothetical protein